MRCDCIIYKYIFIIKIMIRFTVYAFSVYGNEEWRKIKIYSMIMLLNRINT